MKWLEKQIEAGRGLKLLHNERIQSQVMVIEKADQGILRSSGAAMMKSFAKGYYQVDLDKALTKVDISIHVPGKAGSHPRTLHLHGYNIQEWLLIMVRFLKPDGEKVFEVALRNSAATFPGFVSNAAKELLYDQILTAQFPGWTLPPGDYQVEVQGIHIPGTHHTLTWGLQDVLLTW
jgi:hypothetical protein